ncbi:hypothetical protein B0O44_101507 [Pedobacter nutrimenti]|uniref:Uncharacterized protein n=1 Tax=Pedobacter nutrimenti TaxID=1241337 RepID=A0A318UZK9_9SPHI|nr:hypothetical protein B0O44_101507 [Pedobacter nutrimenti]
MLFTESCMLQQINRTFGSFNYLYLMNEIFTGIGEKKINL